MKKASISVIKAGLIILSFTALILSYGCNDDGGEPYNFKLISIQTGADAYLGHLLPVTVTIKALSEVENLPVQFSFMKQSDVDSSPEQENENIDVLISDSIIIPDVSAGENQYQVNIKVPAETGKTGNYYISAVIDPNEVVEQKSSDKINESESDMWAVVNLRDDYLLDTDLVVDSLVLSDDTVMLTKPSIPTDPNIHAIMGTVTVKSANKRMLNTPISFVLTIPTAGDYPLSVWDDDIKGFSSYYYIAELRNDIPLSIPFSLKIDSATRDIIEGLGPSSCTLTVMIDPDDSVAEPFVDGSIGGESNNTKQADLTIIVGDEQVNESKSLGIPKGGLAYSKQYDTGFGNNTFGAKASFSANASLNTTGAYGSVAGQVPITIFGFKFNMAEANAWAKAVPHRISSSGMGVIFKFVGFTLYEYSRTMEFTWEKDWSVYKSYGYSQQFWVGPVPLNVGAGAQGTIGFNINFEVSDNLIANAGPYVYAGAYASASVGVGGLLEAGVRGNLNLINANFINEVTAGITLLSNNTELQGTLKETVSVTIAGPNGNVQLFAKYPCITRWKCCCWGRVCWPIFGICESYYTLVSFTSWSNTYTLLDQEYNTGIIGPLL